MLKWKPYRAVTQAEREEAKPPLVGVLDPEAQAQKELEAEGQAATAPAKQAEPETTPKEIQQVAAQQAE